MYVPPGFWSNEKGDIDVIVHKGMIHVFYLCVPSHDTVGHIVSSDGLVWKQARRALRTGEPGDFDDDQIWTMGVFEMNGTFFMLYTASCREEAGKVQRVGLAVSDDLYAWTKHAGNPVIEADPRWYHATRDNTKRVDWRDPKVLVEDGVAHGVICARAAAGASWNRRGCVGYFTSTDGIHWQVKPPLLGPGAFYEMETPAIFKLGSRYFLTGIYGFDHTTDLPVPNVYRVADRLAGPYRRPHNDLLLPAGNMVFKPCQWNQKTLLFHSLRGIGSWPGAEGVPVYSLAPPKVAEATPEGELILRPFRQWDIMRADTWQEFADAASTCDCESASPDSFHWTPLPQPYDHFIFEAELSTTNCPEFGIAFRAEPDGDEGTFVSIVPGRSLVRLYTLKRRFKNPNAGVIYGTRPRHILQENFCNLTPGAPCTCRLVAFGPYVEVSINNQVLISGMTYVHADGRVGPFAEGGRIDSKNMRLLPLKPPPSVALSPIVVGQPAQL
ncbi:MAG: hypothetical protein K9N51_01345 [Candidatus Pacebacteria bacterium]|nr:hypothetical protein [Candidatus Paceibacterota bacterium]